MTKRKYTKRSDYWDKFHTHKGQPLSDMFEANANQQANQYEPQLVGEPFYAYESKAYSRTSVKGNEVAVRRSNAAIGPKIFPYANNRNELSDCRYGKGGVAGREV